MLRHLSCVYPQAIHRAVFTVILREQGGDHGAFNEFDIAFYESISQDTAGVASGLIGVTPRHKLFSAIFGLVQKLV